MNHTLSSNSDGLSAGILLSLKSRIFLVTIKSALIRLAWFNVDEDNGIPLKLFPNPAQTEVTVQAEEILRIRIIDAIGQVALEKIFDQTDAACIDIGIIPQGVYLVEISTKKGKTMRKLVVSR